MTALTWCQLGWGGNHDVCQLLYSFWSESGVVFPMGLEKMWRGNQGREDEGWYLKLGQMAFFSMPKNFSES